MLKWIFISIFLLCPIWIFAQLADNFSDTNFTQNPAWNGSNGLFTINQNLQLQLKAASAGEAYLTTPNKILSNTEWEFYIQMAFSPSASNFARVYLTSNKNTLNAPLQGYYVQFGEAGSADGIDLWVQMDELHFKLIDGKAGTIAKSLNSVRIKVARDDAGNWSLYSDTLGGTNFNLEGTAKDETLNTTNYFGVYAKYTASNGSKFYWDDFSVKQIIKDTLPPQLQSVQAISDTQLILTFNEPLDENSIGDTKNYIVNNGIGNPVEVSFAEGNPAKILLGFSKAFSANTIYEVSVVNLADITGNKTTMPQNRSFIIKSINKLDVVINEIMTDPSPTLGLPDVEFIELYNTTDQTIQLQGWILSDAKSNAVFGKDSILPNEYVVVTQAASTGLFTSFGRTIGLQNFPSLNNTSENLLLSSANGKIIDKVNYSLDWYKDDTKANGGYTLEKINPTDTCRGTENWIASTANAGGTPGKQNSVYSIIKDTIAPSIQSIRVLDSITVELTFTEALDSNNALFAIFIVNTGATLQNLHIYPGRKMLQVQYNIPFISADENTLTITGIQDCEGNKSINLQTRFTYYKPKTAEQYDIIINEIMANPLANKPLPNAEYIELYNRSKKVISLKNWSYSDVTTKSILPQYILLPDSFVIICAENSVSSLLPFSRNVIGLKTWPGLNNSSDSLYLRDDKDKLIYFITYSNNMHTDELKRSGGWSLELIDTDLPCAQGKNYTSAKDNRGGTPGKSNSVRGKLTGFSAPEATSIQIIDSQTLIVNFSASIDSILTADINRFSIIPYITSVKNASALTSDYTQVKLQLDKPLSSGIVYTLEINGITNCSGKTSEKETIQFGLPELPDSFDVVINEILFNPNSGGSDFVEIYNRSNKIIEVQDLLLGTTDENNTIESVKQLAEKSRLLLPGDYLVVTADAKNIDQNYHVPSPEKIIEISTLPGFSDEAGSVVLLRNDGLRIDQVNYSEDWHFELLSDKNGVSLEKINPGLVSNQSNSWHSAASTAGYATPTYQNSQFQNSTQKQSSHIFNFDPAIFSPDGDGYQDVLNIYYKLPENGWTAKLEIYDVQGRLVRILHNNQLLGSEGYLHWDGLTESGEKAPIGVYIFLASAFNTRGETRTQKLTCTLAGRL